jgi:hypothetical protein
MTQPVRCLSSGAAHRWLVAATMTFIALGAASCGGDDGSAAATSEPSTTIDPSATTSTGPTTGPTTTVSLEAEPPPPDPTSPGATRAATTRSATTRPATTSSTTMQAPAVTSVTIPATVNCPTKSARTLTISWVTKGATKVAIAIDNPAGYYDQDLPPSGHLDVPFPCDGDPQTYFVVAENGVGGRAVTSRTVKPVLAPVKTVP